MYWNEGAGLNSAIYRGNADGTNKERYLVYPDISLSGPLAFCSSTNRLYFIQDSSVMWASALDRSQIETLLTDNEGVLTTLQLVPNAMLYTVKGQPGVRRFQFENKERSMFLANSQGMLAAIYSTKYPKPRKFIDTGIINYR